LAQYFSISYNQGQVDGPATKFALATHLDDDGSDGGNILLGTSAAAGGFVARSLANPDSMVGATEDELAAMVPKDWVAGPVKKGIGTRWLSPKDGKYGIVRFMPNGSPQVDDPLHQEAYGDVSIGGMKYKFAAAGSSVIEDPAVPSVQIASTGSMGKVELPSARSPEDPTIEGGVG